MRVYIKSGWKRFIIPVPLFLIKFGLSIAKSSFVMKSVPEKSRKYIDMIDFKELSKSIDVLKEYRGLRIVQVKAKDGTEVHITI